MYGFSLTIYVVLNTLNTQKNKTEEMHCGKTWISSLLPSTPISESTASTELKGRIILASYFITHHENPPHVLSLKSTPVLFIINAPGGVKFSKRGAFIQLTGGSTWFFGGLELVSIVLKNDKLFNCTKPPVNSWKEEISQL